jgi:hypothetical protein
LAVDTVEISLPVTPTEAERSPTPIDELLSPLSNTIRSKKSREQLGHWHSSVVSTTSSQSYSDNGSDAASSLSFTSTPLSSVYSEPFQSTPDLTLINALNISQETITPLSRKRSGT